MVSRRFRADRAVTFFAPLAFALALVACTPQGAMVSDGGTDATGGNARVAAACSQAVMAAQRCGRPQCEIDQLTRTCPGYLSHYRAEAIDVFESCGSRSECPPDGGRSGAFQTACVNEGIYRLTPTATQRAAADALCAACPGVEGSSSATEASCRANIFQPRDGGATGVGPVLLAMDDATAAAVQANCARRDADAGAFCALGVTFCVVATLGPIENACADAGR